MLGECFALCGDDAATGFERALVIDRAAGDSGSLRRDAGRAWHQLVREGVLERATLRAGGRDFGQESVARGAAVRGAMPQAGRDRWRLSSAGLVQARERRRRIGAWRDVLDAAVENGRDALTLDLPAPEEVLEGVVLAPLAAAWQSAPRAAEDTR